MKNKFDRSIQGDIILYTSPDQKVKVNVLFGDETVWLTQKQIAELFEKSLPTINEHLKNAYDEAELDKKATLRKFRTVQEEGNRKIKRELDYYNLDAILAVGYRVKSLRGTQFRVWATQRLREYIIKGFTLDDERLKQGGERARYFEELLQRVRDIRTSERNFYQKVTDIYATSIDYRKDDKLTQEFFATVQNKMHYAVCGHTAAEIIAGRANSQKPLMGLTSFKGDYLTEGDIFIAKNYLSERELKQLNLIVSLYLDFAELQALDQKPMQMQDWISKLDEFLRLSQKGILNNAGKVSAKEAKDKAVTEFKKYRKGQDKALVSDFDREVKKLLRGNKRRGGYIALITVLVTGAVGVAIAVSLLLLGLGSSRTSFAVTQSNQAKALANACAEEALQQIHDSTPFEGTGNATLGQGNCTYTVTKQIAQNRTITASGTVGTIVRKVKITIDKITPNINIVSWQEVADF